MQTGVKEYWHIYRLAGRNSPEPLDPFMKSRIVHSSLSRQQGNWEARNMFPAYLSFCNMMHSGNSKHTMDESNVVKHEAKLF